jgi:glycine/D-amino acid oxidase-like deaminating enzyme
VLVVSACSGHGFKFAPAVGELVAEEVLTGHRSPELAPFAWRASSVT